MVTVAVPKLTEAVPVKFVVPLGVLASVAVAVFSWFVAAVVSFDHVQLKSLPAAKEYGKVTPQLTVADPSVASESLTPLMVAAIAAGL